MSVTPIDHHRSITFARRSLAIFVRFAALAPLLLILEWRPAIAQPLGWTDLPVIPDATGFAGPVVGVSEDQLLVAGGANFPDKPPWEGGTKRWHDRVFVLDRPSGAWRIAGTLPCRVAYSVCVTTSRGIAVLGGNSEAGHTAECYLLRLAGSGIEVEVLPPLPRAIAGACGGLLAGRLYVAGGTENRDAVQALNTFYWLDLEQPQQGWRNEPTWPGVGRMLATAAVVDDAFYLVGGVTLAADPQRRPRRTYLRDAYKFVPASGWTKIADLPWPLAAGPSPAPVASAKQLLILGGDDGSQLSRPPQQHTGFRREVLAFDPRHNRWSEIGTLPVALVTTTAVTWQGRILVPGGEIRPGVRSTRVLSAREK